MAELTRVYRGNKLSGFVDGEPVFKMEYYGPGEDGQQIANQGWRIYEARWHTMRQGRPVQNRRPRWALVGVFDSQSDAEAEIERRWPSG